jgi:hypothetical protein
MCVKGVIVSIQESGSGDIKDNVNSKLVLFAASCKKVPWSEFVFDRCTGFSCFDETLTKKCYDTSSNIVYSKQRDINLNAIGWLELLNLSIALQVVD